MHTPGAADVLGFGAGHHGEQVAGGRPHDAGHVHGIQPGLLRPAVVGVDQNFQIVGDHIAHAGAHAIEVAVVDVAVQRDVVGVAVALLDQAVDAHEQLVVDHRRVDRCLDVVSIEPAVGCLAVGLEFVFGLSRDHLDGTTAGVAAIQRALGAAQHLHPLDVIQAEIVDALAGDEHVVQIKAQGRVHRDDGFGGAHAAQEHGGGTALADVVVAHQVGHVVDDVDHVERLAPLDLHRVEGADGHRHVLKPRFAPLGGHDHLLQHQARVALALLLLGRYWRRRQHRASRAHHPSQSVKTSSHRSAPPLRHRPAPP